MNQHIPIDAAAAQEAAVEPQGAAAPALSICIPTFNRARHLERLLARLKDETEEFRDMIEIIVSDNASPDDTEAVCAAAGLGGALRYFRQEENLGAARNIWFAWSQARGKYAIYLADDDILLWPGLFDALNLLERNPQAVGLYAPWQLIDLESGRDGGLFYQHEGAHTFSHKDRAAFVRFVLRHQVFSEIAIFRTELLRRIAPVFDDLAFWAFTIPVELLSFGDLIYADTPFYGSVTKHPGLPSRAQAGHEQVMSAWDSYRGGVEHLIGLAEPASEGEAAECRAMADRLVQIRMVVALRLRIANDRDPIESYFLASRLRGLGCERLLPISMDALRQRAAIAFLDDRMPKRIGAERIVLIGYDEEAAARIAGVARIPAAPRQSGDALGARDIVLVAGNGGHDAPVDTLNRAGFVITESDLMAKFP
jgi:glycosyltransferase involved in cell wall biosynthesis